MMQITGYHDPVLDDFELQKIFADHDEGQKLIQRTLAEHHIHGYEIELRRLDSSIISARISAQMFEWQGEQSIIAVVEDVSEQLATRAALVAQMARNQQILDTMQDGYFLVNADGHILDVNQAYCEIVGRSSEELLGNSVYQLDTDLWHNLTHLLGQDSRQTQAIRRETRSRHKSGRLVDTETNMVVMKEDGHTFLGCFVRDITERKQVEYALRSSEEKFRSSFNSSGIGIGLSTLEGRFVEINPKLSEILGYSAEEMLDLSATDITHKNELYATVSAYKNLLNGTSDSFEMEKRYIRKDGQIVWAHTVVALVRNEQHLPAYFIFQVQDITDRKITEQALAEERNLLRTLIDSLPDLEISTQAKSWGRS